MNNYIKYLSIIILSIIILYFYYYNNKNKNKNTDTNIEHFNNCQYIFNKDYDFNNFQKFKPINLLLDKNVTIYGYPGNKEDINIDNITEVEKTNWTKGSYILHNSHYYYPTTNCNQIKTVEFCNNFTFDYLLITKIKDTKGNYYRNNGIRVMSPRAYCNSLPIPDDQLALCINTSPGSGGGDEHKKYNLKLSLISLYLINKYKYTTEDNFRSWEAVPYGLLWKKISNIPDDTNIRILNYHTTKENFNDGFYLSTDSSVFGYDTTRILDGGGGWGHKEHRYEITDPNYLQPNTRTAPLYIIAEDIAKRIKSGSGGTNNYKFSKTIWDKYFIEDLRINDYIIIKNESTDDYWKPILNNIGDGSNPHGFGVGELPDGVNWNDNIKTESGNSVEYIKEKEFIKHIYTKSTKDHFRHILRYDNNGGASAINHNAIDAMHNKTTANQETFELNDQQLAGLIAKQINIIKDTNISIFDIYFKNANGVIYVPKLIPDLHNGYLTLKGFEDTEYYNELSVKNLNIDHIIWSKDGGTYAKYKIMSQLIDEKKYNIAKCNDEDCNTVSAIKEVEIGDIITDLEYDYNNFVENKKSLINKFSDVFANVAGGLPPKTTCNSDVYVVDTCNVCYNDIYDINSERFKHDMSPAIKNQYAIKNIIKTTINMPDTDTFIVGDYVKDTSVTEYGTITSINSENDTCQIIYDNENEETTVNIVNLELVDKIIVTDNRDNKYDFGIIDKENRSFSYVLDKDQTICDVLTDEGETSADVNDTRIIYNGRTWYNLSNNNIGKKFNLDDNNFIVNGTKWELVENNGNMPNSLEYCEDITAKLSTNFINLFTISEIGDYVTIDENKLESTSASAANEKNKDHINYNTYIKIGNNYYRPVDCNFEDWIQNSDILGNKEEIRILYKNSQRNCCQITNNDEISNKHNIEDADTLNKNKICIHKDKKTEIEDNVKREKSKECLLSQTKMTDLSNKFIHINNTYRNQPNGDLNEKKHNLKKDETTFNNYTYINKFKSGNEGYGLIGELVGDYQKIVTDSVSLKTKINEYDTSSLELLSPPYSSSSKEFNFDFINTHINNINSTCLVKDANTAVSFSHNGKDYVKTNKIFDIDAETITRPDIDLNYQTFDNEELYYEKKNECDNNVSDIELRKKKCLYSWVNENMYDKSVLSETHCALSKTDWDNWNKSGELQFCDIVDDDKKCASYSKWVRKDSEIQDCGVDLSTALSDSKTNFISDVSGDINAFYIGPSDGDDLRTAYNSSDYKLIEANDLICPLPINKELRTYWCETHDISDGNFDKCCLEENEKFDSVTTLSDFKDFNYWPYVCGYYKNNERDGNIIYRDCNDNCYTDNGEIVETNNNFGKIYDTGGDGEYELVSNCDIAKIYKDMAPIIKLKKEGEIDIGNADDTFENSSLTDTINSVKAKNLTSGDYITLTPVEKITLDDSGYRPTDSEIIDKDKLYKLSQFNIYSNDIIDTILNLDNSNRELNDSNIIIMLNDYSIHFGLDYTFLKDINDNYWNIIIDINTYWVSLLNNIYNFGNYKDNDIYDMNKHKYVITKLTSNTYIKWIPIKPYKIITKNTYWGYIYEPKYNDDSPEKLISVDTPTYLKIPNSEQLKTTYKNRKEGGCSLSKSDLYDSLGNTTLKIIEGGQDTQEDMYGWWPKDKDFNKINDYIKYENCAYHDDTDIINDITVRSNDVYNSYENKSYKKAGPWDKNAENDWYNSIYNDHSKQTDQAQGIYLSCDTKTCDISGRKNHQKNKFSVKRDSSGAAIPDGCTQYLSEDECNKTGTYCKWLNNDNNKAETTSGSCYQENPTLQNTLIKGKEFKENSCFQKKCEDINGQSATSTEPSQQSLQFECNNATGCYWDYEGNLGQQCKYLSTPLNIDINDDDVEEKNISLNNDYHQPQFNGMYKTINKDGTDIYITDKDKEVTYPTFNTGSIKRLDCGLMGEKCKGGKDSAYIKNIDLKDYWPLDKLVINEEGKLDYSDISRNIPQDNYDINNYNVDTLFPYITVKKEDGSLRLSDEDINDIRTNYKTIMGETCAVDKDNYNNHKYARYILEYDDDTEKTGVYGIEVEENDNDEEMTFIKIKDLPDTIGKVFYIGEGTERIKENKFIECSSGTDECSHIHANIIMHNGYRVNEFGLNDDDDNTRLYNSIQQSEDTVLPNDNYYTPYKEIKSIVELLEITNDEGEKYGKKTVDSDCLVQSNYQDNIINYCDEAESDCIKYGRIIDDEGNRLLYSNKNTHEYAKHRYNTLLGQFENAKLGGDDNNPFCDEDGIKQTKQFFANSITSTDTKPIFNCNFNDYYQMWDFSTDSLGDPILCDINNNGNEWYNPDDISHYWSK